MSTRREFLSLPLAFARPPAQPLTVPIHIVIDTNANWTWKQIGSFWRTIWPEAIAEFSRCGIRLESTTGTGQVERPPHRQPVVTGLVPGTLNLVVTDHIPAIWDLGMALAGVAARYRGFHLCMIALAEAHGNQIPFLAVNTCVHEILHALMLDIFEERPDGVRGQAREFRIDWYATCLWLFHTGPGVRESARRYLERARPH
jgi:hypothetical protein